MSLNKFSTIFIVLTTLIIGWLIIIEKNKNAIDINQQEVIKIDTDNWITYTNEKMGFLIKHPRTVNGSQIVFIEKGDVVFVTTVSSTLYKEKEKLNLTSQSAILAKADEIEDSSGPVAWAIKTYEVNSDDDLNKIIQEKYNDLFPNGCILGAITSSTQEGVSNIGIDPVNAGEQDKYDSDSSCWINSRLGFKYSPEYHRASIWDIGQEGEFLIDCESSLNCEADSLMAESFRFIPLKP